MMQYASVAQSEEEELGKPKVRSAPENESRVTKFFRTKWIYILGAVIAVYSVAATVTIVSGPSADSCLSNYAKHRQEQLGKKRNVYWDESALSKDVRYAALGQKGATLWMTGLSGSGKSTLGKALEHKLITEDKVHVYRLDGDNVRIGLNRDLGFSAEDRAESVRRVGEMAALFADSGVVTIVSLVSPYRHDRDMVRELHDKMGVPFIEVFMDVTLDVVMKRDPKGLYKKVKEGKIKGFTGVDSPYEAPLQPEVHLFPDDASKIPGMVKELRDALVKRGILIGGPVTQGYPALSPADGVAPLQFKDKALPNTIDLSSRNKDEVALLSEKDIGALREEAETLPKILITDIDVQWAQIIGEGWAAPLKGFMREGTLLQTLHFNSILVDKYNLTGNADFHNFKTDFDAYSTAIQNGERVSMPIPIVLAINDMQKKLAAGHSAVTLVAPSGKQIAILRNPEIYKHRKEELIARTFGTKDYGHPYIKIINNSGDWLIGGELDMLGTVTYNDGLDQYRLSAAELREKFISMGADAVVAFQTRNPTHAGHAHLMKSALKQLREKGFKRPVLWLSPLGGWTKDDDVPLDVRVLQHEAIIKEGMLDANNTVLAIWPSPMIYAGPTEVQWHAKSRRNAGASYFVVGRDPAGLKRSDNSDDVYAGEHGRYVLQTSPGLENLKILSFSNVYYDVKDHQMKQKDESRPGDFLSISGSKMRKMAKNGAKPCNGRIPPDWKDNPSCVPDGFMQPKGWAIVCDYYQNVKNPAKTWIPYSRQLVKAHAATDREFGDAGTFGQSDYALYFMKEGQRISPWHDIPLKNEKRPNTFNFVVEIPMGTMAKMEINKERKHNPIKQDTSKGRPRYYTYGVPFFNYGAFPQTWEDPQDKDAEGHAGDNDPLDVIELGSTSLPVGSVVPVKVLGSLSLIDQGEVDTKVLVLNAKDDLFGEVDDVNDFQRKRPEVIPRLIDWLKKYKTSDGKPENVLAQDTPVGKDDTLKIIDKNHNHWKALVSGPRNDTEFYLPS